MKLSGDGKTLLEVTAGDIKEDGSFDIPAGVTSIGMWAFDGCSGLQSITIPQGVNSIGEAAFRGCSGLQSITIPQGITSIGAAAFYGCSGLQSIIIPVGVTSIGMATFEGCIRLQSITIPAGLTSIDGWAFQGCSGLQSVTIPEGVTSIENYAFRSCSGLQSIAIPQGVTSIGVETFLGCSGLQSLTIPQGVTSIEIRAFSGCSGLQSITIPAEVTFIGSDAFDGCSNLDSIVITSQSEAVRNSIASLLPDDLKSKVILKELADEVFKFRDAELSRLLQVPETNPLFRFFNMKSHHSSRVKGANGVEGECSKLPDELLQTINRFSGDNRYYQKAQRRIRGLPLPANADAVRDYKNKITAIVNESMSKAKNFRSVLMRQLIRERCKGRKRAERGLL
ncbi:leucine-rich repeat domain-containing protein [Legionella cherrii]|uniref:Bacterial surface protein 26-residue repeat n=3 Tax=Legionella cherrii TaxID=28084 RepID=A0ABY6T6W4_9GAMM|nr:leucine-rich repeat domain-containing protein [Legionella cherrii]VEB37249.1 bacterial surface protein 26-residue repeat [Legionella cherrii]